jgi:hypothetical protein
MNTELAERKIDESLRAHWRADPQGLAAAIVRTADPADAHRAEAEAAGLTVRRVFRLVPALAVEGSLSDLLALASRAWVLSVSLDREVHALRGTLGARRQT